MDFSRALSQRSSWPGLSGLDPAIPIPGARCSPERDRRDKPGDDGGAIGGTVPKFSASLTGILCGIGAAVFWAAGFAATRHGIDIGLSPFDIVLHRFLWS